MRQKLVWIGLLLAFVGISSGSGMAASDAGRGEIPVFVSEDNALLLKTGPSHQGLVLVDTANGKETLVATSRGAGYYASISPDNRYVCFKLIEDRPEGGRQFTPMLFDIAGGVLIPLAEPSSEAGTPVVSREGKIAFTVGNVLTVLGADFTRVATLDLGHHVNLLALAPDGSSVA